MNLPEHLPSGAPALQLHEVARAFAGVQAVARVSLEVARGERLAIIGPNGAGKTTLFNLISGELRPDRGRIFLHGQDVTLLPAHRRALSGVGRTYQLTNLLPSLTVMENVLLAALAQTSVKYMVLRPLRSYRPLYERGQETLRLLSLWEVRDVPITELSYGEQRQVEIALAIAGAPRVLLLDEPTAGLSPSETRRMTEILRSLPPDMTTILIEHDMAVAFGVCNRVVVMHQGTVTAAGTPEEIRQDVHVREIYLGTNA